MRKLIDEWGWDWYGRYWAILGKVAMLVDEGNLTFALQTNDGRPLPIRLLANDCSTNVQRMKKFCDYMANNHLIDKQSWLTKRLIYVPKLQKRCDEYTAKLLRKSGHAPDQEEIRLEKEEEKSTIKDNRENSKGKAVRIGEFISQLLK